MDADRIHAAVTSLLDACYDSDDPVVVLHAELARLRATGEWSQLQLAQLRLMALQTVKSIVSRYKRKRPLVRLLPPTDGRNAKRPCR